MYIHTDCLHHKSAMFNAEGQKFKIRGGGAEFADRQKNLFDKLNEAARVTNSVLAGNSGQDDASTIAIGLHPIIEEEMAMDFNTSKHLKRKRRSETKHLRGKESIFKRPEAPPPWHGRSNIPDHKKNPHKWTKYTLDDVSQDDMSDRSNTSTAISFLSELRKRKESSGEFMDSDEAPQESVTFRRPYRSIQRATVEVQQPLDRLESNKPVFRGTKRIMPEYVVGQGPSKDKKKLNKNDVKLKSTPTKELKLNHLLEDENENSE